MLLPSGPCDHTRSDAPNRQGLLRLGRHGQEKGCTQERYAPLARRSATHRMRRVILAEHVPHRAVLCRRLLRRAGVATRRT